MDSRRRRCRGITRKVGQLRGLDVEFVFGSDEGSFFGMTAAQATWRELDAWVRQLSEAGRRW